MDITINYLAVVVAAALAFGLGAWWYSPLGFGKMWMAMMGLTEEKMKSMPLSPTQAMGVGAVVMLVQAFVLALFVSWIGVATFEGAMYLSFWVWLGFFVPTLANGWLWEGKTPKPFAFNAAYSLVSIALMALVLGL